MNVLSAMHGAVIITVEQRGGKDGGPSLRLMASLPGTSPKTSDRLVEIWRADCFQHEPHEHFFGPMGEWVANFSTIAVVHSIELALQKLHKIRELVRTAGYTEYAMSFSCTLLPPSDLTQIAAWMRTANR